MPDLRTATLIALENKRVSDIMTPRTVLFTMSTHTTMGELREKARSWVYSRVPVYDKNREDIVGVVLRRDVLVAIAEDRWDVSLSDLMRPVDFVVEIHPLDRLMNRFLKQRQHLLVVLDELGGLAGVVTLEDLLEEILGQEIVDEFDTVADLREIAHRRRERTLSPRQPEKTE